MTEIIYNHETDLLVIGLINLNGKNGAIEVYKDEERWEDDDSFVIFHSAEAASQFAESLLRRLQTLGAPVDPQ